MQLEAADCGAAALGIVLAHFGKWVSLEELRAACGAGRDGSSAEDLVRAARAYGLNATGWRREVHQLASLSPPMILFWQFSHFVVLEGIRDGRYYLNDPASGHRVVEEDQFDRHFTGVALVFEPGEAFQPGGKPPGVLCRMWPWLREFKATLAFASICGLLLALALLAPPVLLAIFVDQVLVGGQDGWDGALVGAMVGAGVLTYLLTWLQMRSLRRLVLRISADQSARYVRQLFRLPVQYFAHRFAGDLASRVQLIDQIAKVGAGELVGLAIELVMATAFLALMLAFDAFLGLAVAALGLLCVLFMRSSIRFRRDKNHRLRRDQGILVGVGMAGLRSVDALRATAQGNDFFSRWSGYQARELQARQDFAELGHVIGACPALFQLLGAAVVLGLGGLQVVSGEMSLGVLMGFYVIAGNFLHPIGRLVQFSDLLETLSADLQRLDDVLDASGADRRELDRSGPSPAVVTSEGRLRLVGSLEFRNVTFGFQHHRPPFIEGFSLEVHPGQRVALVGPSGSGKSTLALLAAGVYRPWSGEILFDGRPRGEIPREVLSVSVSHVAQHAVLFASTVRDNLALWDPAVPDERLFAAARDAAIHEEIIARPLGYDAPVEEGGRNFSGGQRMRLEIARALVSKPSVLIVDEATSSLDAGTELRIDDSLRRRGCTCFIIAHRLSTIRDCDRIVVLDKGKVVQQGTHDELMGMEEGMYRSFLHAD